MEKAIKTSNGLLISPRSKLRLKPEEAIQLKEYTENERGAFETIRANTRIHPDTIRAGIERGWFEAAAALKLSAFLKKIKTATA